MSDERFAPRELFDERDGPEAARDPLRREHERALRGPHRAIDFRASTAAALAPSLRRWLGAHWRRVHEAEHRSAGIFATFVLDLLGAGAPPEVLTLAARAPLDELRHAHLAAQLSEAYAGVAPSPPVEVPRAFDDPALSNEALALRQALFLTVGAETFSCLLLAAQREQAEDPCVRAVLSVLLRDEVLHARLGWRWLGARCREPAQAEATRALLREQLVPVFDDLVRGLFDDPAALPAPTHRGAALGAARAHGYLPGREAYALFHRALREVWEPGLGALGVDARALAARYPAPRALRAR